MSNRVRIELQPLGKTVTLPKGGGLQDVLFAQGVEFPCGGRGRCRGCKIKVVDGELAVTPEDRASLSEAEIGEGWRLACRAKVTGNLKLELAQWEAPILADHSSVSDFEPRDGLGIAVDLGTTTIVAQLLDLRTSHVLGVKMGLNAQARHGADIMSRIDFAVAGGMSTLTGGARGQIGGMIGELLAGSAAGPGKLESVVVVGNTVMHHLFCGIDVTPLAHIPFEPTEDGLREFRASELGWELPGNPLVRFLPCLGGFVGSDVLGGIMATRLHEAEAPCALIDLGTNGEIVVGNRERMVCASTAAGPAFEGARISMGMRAATGAIAEVRVNDGELHCHVLGHAKPRGICGSGLVDAVAGGLDLERIRQSGRLAHGSSLMLASPVALSQADIRELQLAKGAIAAGAQILANVWGVAMEEIATVYLAGAFGNYINRASARRIGLINFPIEKVQAAGNTALLGAKLALLRPPDKDKGWSSILDRTRHICLHEDPQFQEIYAEQMSFPAATV